MILFLLLVTLLLPFTMIGFGLAWKNHPPKVVNDFYGYRTKQSMKSQQTWDFAHRYFARIWLYLGIVLAIVSTIIILVFCRIDLDSLGEIISVLVVIQCMILCLPIIPTEIKLKKHFDRFGRRKN
ncbi:MAG: hypothetical protein K0S47_3549 [Herbinix sp.]|jgi:uncharacterized membrane protein|nr:hypothetical protein [Herbinix sp.]